MVIKPAAEKPLQEFSLGRVVYLNGHNDRVTFKLVGLQNSQSMSIFRDWCAMAVLILLLLQVYFIYPC